MDNIQFQEDSFKRNNYSSSATPKGFAGFLVKNGVAKDGTSANIILTVLALCVFGVSIYFFVYGFNSPRSSVPLPVESARPFPPAEGI